MTFFNRKEEVLEVQLTPHGRYLLSLGEWQPVYYAFFDDDVVYDSNYIGFSESQNNTESRIKETPRPHCQATFRDVEDHINSTYKTGGKNLQNYFEREYSLSSELGIADYYSNSSPAWDIDTLKGEISSSVATYSGSGPNYAIPQINMKNLKYKKIVGPIGSVLGPEPIVDGEDYLRDLNEYEFTYVDIRKDFVLLELDEANTVFQKENFEVELFLIEDETEGATTTEVLVPLKFSGADAAADSSTEFIDYFFDISADMEINEDILCKYKGVDTSKGIFLQRAFECAPGPNLASTDQYQSDVSDPGEVCD
tara:strand:+ start:838 stop:1767 length:930 start_codon:yes stop_codon:yes gene_type:complete